MDDLKSVKNIDTKNLSFKFYKFERINKKKDINYVLTNGEKFFKNGLLVYILNQANKKQNYSRIAVLVSRKVEKSAVIRNKFKRRIKEIFRLNKYKIRIPIDIVVIATKISVKQKYNLLEESFLKILETKGLLNQ
jgi:ribonuclease P protein component